jgi:glutaconyl-CoA/methylmalonyl-CoA decarboxylase subunit gamma
MSKKLQVKVNGKPFEVEVDDVAGDVVNVNVNGKAFEVEFEKAGAPAVKAAPVAAPVKVAEPMKAAGVPASTSNSITSPMPGVIMDISVKVGDKVAPKQPICALEAMKMKNIIRSTREGVVASIEVTDGQRVAFGAVIIRFA